MKTLSIFNRKFLWICLVLFCGVAAVLGALCLSKGLRKTEGSFFEIAGFSAADVETVTICYQDTSVELSEADRQRLLDSLEATQGQLVEYDHDYPYHLTQFPLQFHVKDEVFEYPMAWFSGYEYVVKGSGDEAMYTSWIDYTDRRVDMQIGGDWFSFRQIGNSFWNEDISSISYGAANRGNRMNSANASVGGYRYVKDVPDFADPSYYVYSADLVVIATLTGQEYHLDPDYRYYTYPTYYFEVDEVLKGQYDSDEPLTADWKIGTPLLPDGSEYIPPYDDVMMGGTDNHYEYLQEGRQYLLFYEANPHYDTASDLTLEQQPYYPLTRCSFTYWLAAIYGDTAHPVVNHENHAFYEIPLEEIRALCNAYDVHNFFEIAGFSEEDVTNVSICFDGVSHDLQETERQRLLNSLKGTQGSLVQYNHEYPYYVSEYQIQLYVGDEMYEFPFAWFSGFEYVITGSGDAARYSSLIQYTDRRVDVQINGNWYTFQQAEDIFWNEDISYMAYYSGEDAKQDFSTACSSSEFGYMEKSPDYFDPKYFVYNASLIVVAQNVDREYVPVDDSYLGRYDYAVDEFEVMEVLKGEWDTTKRISLTGFSPNLKSENKATLTGPRPIMQGGLVGDWHKTDDVGDTFLLFLDYHYNESTNEWEIDFFRNPRYSLARIYNGTAYACVNHENHAFFNMPLPELRNLCDECIMHEHNAYAADMSSIVASDAELSANSADVDSFVVSSIQTCLLNAGSENYVFSPATLYLQLGLLAEASGGDTRSQILAALGSSDMAAIRSRVSSIYNANQITDTWEHTSTISNSLWIDETCFLKNEVVRSLAALYKTSAYRGDTDSVSFNHFFRDWSIEQIQYDPVPEELLPSAEQALSVLGTTYMNIAWEEPFSLLAYSEETFTSPTDEITCEFMHQTTELNYYQGDHFSAVSKSLASGGEVKFILPDSDSSIALLLNDAEVMNLMVSDLCSESQIDYEKTTVNLSIPKFKLFCNADLAEPLASMGITDIFNDEKANLSQITYDETSFSLSQLLHVNRVVINPDGCVRRYEEWDPFADPEFTKGEGIDFVVDRPFLFMVTGPDGMPLLTGVIHEPGYVHRMSIS